MSEAPQTIRVLEVELGALASLAVAGLLRVTIGAADDDRSEFLSVIPASAIQVLLLASEPMSYRQASLSEIRPLTASLSDDPDVLARVLRGGISTRHALMVRVGFPPWRTARKERAEWYAQLAAVRPWDPARFTDKVRELIAVCEELGSTGPHVRSACVRAAQRALPWRLDDADEEWRAAEIKRLILGE